MGIALLKQKLVALFLCFAILTPTFLMQTNAVESYNFYYYNDTALGGMVITGISNNHVSEVVIPDKIENTDVVAISNGVFRDNTYITSVTLPQNLKRIGSWAFGSCSSLKTVIFNDKLERIEDYAFHSCYALESNPTIPSLKFLGQKAFYECKRLTYFYGLDALTDISSGAFLDCTGIKSVIIPQGVTYIGESAFYGCSGIEEITLYETLKGMGKGTFYGVRENVKVNFIGSEIVWRRDNPLDPYSENVYLTNNITFTIPCNHQWRTSYFKEPTCQEEGYISRYCLVCFADESKPLPLSKEHNYDIYYETFPDCTTDGRGYEECADCGYVCATDVIIPKNGHEFSEIVKYVAPTITKSGKWVYGCEWCDATKTVKIDPTGKKLSKAKISVSNKTYTGKSQKPTVTVKYSGKKLKKGTDYTVSYKNNKKIGTATAIIKGKGKYVGTRTVTFKITPKKTSIKKLSSGKKKIKVKWGKVTNSSGYQIVVATNKGFSKNKKEIYVKSKSSDSKTITKLKAKKTYYVRLRAYKTVKGKKIYGPYTKTLKIKTK